jgi:radical SAM protein with 4Fe4S-binding SPASM domain
MSAMSGPGSDIDEASLHPLIRARYPLREMPRPRSLAVRMDITNKCNLDCMQCTLRANRLAAGESPSDMSVDLFGRIARQIFPYAHVVGLSCEAEPTMHGRFEDILGIVGATPGPGYLLTTNGTTLTERRIQALFDCNMGGITVSIDGATAATFERIRRNGRFERVVEAIERIDRVKRSRGLGRDHFPLLQVNYTLMRSTVGELPAMVELCRRWNVHRLTLQHVYVLDQTGLQGESLAHAPALSDGILRACKARCEAAGIQTTFPVLFDPDPEPPAASEPPVATPAEADPFAEPSLSCYAPWRMLRIRWNGTVHPCDLWSGAPIGDLRTQSFEEVWNGPAYLRLRWDHARCRPTHPSCVGCNMVTTDNLEGRAKRTPLVLTPAAP